MGKVTIYHWIWVYQLKMCLCPDKRYVNEITNICYH